MNTGTSTSKSNNKINSRIPSLGFRDDMEVSRKTETLGTHRGIVPLK